MSEKPEAQYVSLDDEFDAQRDERIEYDADGTPIFKFKRRRSEIDDLIADGLIEDENGEWAD